MKLRSSIYFILIFFSSTALAQLDHWESVIVPGDNWKYTVPNEQPAITWIQSGFDDAAWSEGATGLGYGDGDDATVIDPTVSLYMRRQFEIFSTTEIESLILDMDYDDGFVAYLNGVEIARSLVSGDIPGYDQVSDGDHEALLYNGIDPERFYIDKNILAQGTNILAIEIHNRDITSSDMTSIPTLSVGVNTASFLYNAVPDWFDEPFFPGEVIFESSNLPIVILKTDGGWEIPDEPKIGANMTIIDNGTGNRNYLTDVTNPISLNYNGAIQIEVRGSSSQALPKKQYALTTYDITGAKNNVSILGMPAENDWILNGLAFDPSLMRDFISYQLSLAIGQYASRGVYCEVVLNGVYQGLYIMQEKLKADDNRIDINKIEPGDHSGDDLTGGYITKADKTEGSDVAAWWMESYVNGYYTAFIHEHPKPNEVTVAQNAYIQDQFYSLASAAGAHNISLAFGYPSVIDLPSFIDFMIINELAANVDGYQFSTYFHKDRNAKLRAGPVWDFNLTFGNDLFLWGFDRSHTDIWQFDDGDNVGARFWKDLFDDNTYRCYFKARWTSLTQPGQPLHPDQLNTFIDQVTQTIAEAIPREEQRWGTVGDHAAHISAMKQWINERVIWITNELSPVQGCITPELPALAITKINYHPKTADGTGEKDREFIEITNIGGEMADLTGVYFGGTGLVYQFAPFTKLDAGKSLMLANEVDVFTETYGFTPFDAFSRSLNNGGQRIQLLDGYGNIIDEVTYSDDAPWPVAADGDGYFLELIDPLQDHNDPTNWRASEWVLTAIASENTEPSVSIYPNPASDVITIVANEAILSLKILDINGRLLQAAQPKGNRHTLAISALDETIYIVEIQTLRGISRQKLLIGNK